ncbi:MAG: 5-bromo-4-chloroindolyl phosphate hydrolysis family protein [Oscillospiraceae bacterium]
MAKRVKKSVAPIYAVAVLWLVWGLFFPLYKPFHFVLAAIASVAVFCLGKVIWPNKTYNTPDPEPKQEEKAAEPAKPESTGNPEIDALIAERDRAVSEMHRLNDSIEDPTISAQIDRLESTTKKIIAQVVQNPDKLPQIRRFLNYYLPTTLKLLNAYDRADSAGISGTNIDGTKGKVSEMMDTIVTAFDKQLDALFGDEALDISTDITVMEQMLAREGIGGTQITTES